MFLKGNKSYWGGLYGSSGFLAIVDWVKTNQQVALMIADDANDARRINQGLAFYAHQLDIINFPDYEVLAYDTFSAHEDSIAGRLKALSTLPKLQTGIVVVTLESLLQRLCPPTFITQNTLSLKVGQTLSLSDFKKQLLRTGYYPTNTVREQGEFSAKGSLLDLYPAGSDTPYRLDFFDNTLESIRAFDTQDQRSTQSFDAIDLLPAKEFATNQNAIATFKTQYQDYFGHQNGWMLEEVSQGRFPGGIEFYLPLFFQETATLFSYLPDTTVLISSGNEAVKLKDIYLGLDIQFEKAQQNADLYPLSPKDLFLPQEIFFAQFGRYRQLIISQTPASGNREIQNHHYKLLPAVRIENNHPAPLQKLLSFLTNFEGRVLLVCESLSRQAILLDLLSSQQIKTHKNWYDFNQASSKLASIVGDLDEGFLSDNIALIAEKNLFGELSVQQRRRRAKHKDFDQPIKTLIELTIGDAVVHEQYGIGRYLGLKIIDYDGVSQEFLSLAYANDDKLLVPIAELNLVSRYGGVSSEHVPLHRLGSPQWAKAKKKAADGLYDIAADLLEIYAKRASQTGFACDEPDDSYQAFVAEFGFEETPDQLTTTQAVLSDMCSSKPMDRLVCGDVGFGKTEIAMRAAFLAVNSGKQVAILVPTTLLADQHHRSFLDRFVNHSVNIAVLSRFITPKQQKTNIEALQNGRIDVVVGTHKLLQPKIKYKNLGLIIIDEEHRFGVKQKEILKQMRSQCDILTMSATPIPRTLNMALGEIRDLSVIATPPLGRNSIKTFVDEWDDATVKEACLREIHRAGQIFVLHNDIDSIDLIADKMDELLPGAKVRIAHGQMPSKQLESIMSDFYHQRFHILVCTTIIETGIDIPSANTIIINNAQNFGLAQLHQLRGRVGRSHHRAYAYLLVKSKQSLSDDARKRLHAISSLEALGSGFMLANHDLEIRGSGDLLGKDQSGSIQSVGFNFYHDMLKRTIKAFKSGDKNISFETQKPIHIDTGISTIIPEYYLGDPHERLIFYKRISTCQNDDELDNIRAELIDRFGNLEPPTESLFASAKLKLSADELGIESLHIYPESLHLTFSQSTKVKIEKIIGLIQSKPNTYRLKNQATLVITSHMPADIERIETAQAFLSVLS